MVPLIKIDLDKTLKSDAPVIIDLGCGPKKKHGRIGIDKLNLPTVDIVADLENGLPFLPDNSVDQIHSSEVFGCIENFENLMREVVRVLKKDGTSYVFVPHFSNPHYYSDYEHKRFFGLYTSGFLFINFSDYNMYANIGYIQENVNNPHPNRVLRKGLSQKFFSRLFRS